MAQVNHGPLTLRADNLGQYKWHVVRDCNNEPHNANAYHSLTDTFERLQEHGWEYTTTTLTIFIETWGNGSPVQEVGETLPRSPPPYMHHFRKRKEPLVEPESAEPETTPPPPKKHRRK